MRESSLFTGLIASLFFTIVTPAHAFDKGGLGDEACFHFNLYAISVTSAKAVSKNANEYYFTAKGSAGVSSCPFYGGTYPVSVWARWDGATGIASEQISQGDPSSPKFIVTHIHATCAKDPWLYAVSCSLNSQSNTNPGSDYSGLTFTGPFPVTAGLLSSTQRKILMTTTTPYQDFTLPPNTPPVIVSPAQDVIIRNGSPVAIQIKRPLDGSDKWYADRTLQFEVQFEVYREVRVGGANPARVPASLGAMWTRVDPNGLIGTAMLSTTPLSVSLTAFSTQGPGNSGDWQSWRMRTRLTDPVTSRPWSSWRTFFVVVPASYTKMPGVEKPVPGFEKPAAGGLAPSSKSPITKPGVQTPTSPVIPPQLPPVKKPNQASPLLQKNS